MAHGKFKLPLDHQPVMKKPTGGEFVCRDCRYVSANGKACTNENFVEFMGSPALPWPADEMCSDWFEPRA